jgi:iron-sulfur cluster repair protein YtfE (RIC family)
VEIWTIIEEDHRKIEAILRQLYDDRYDRRELLRQLREELIAHTAAEEKANYPVLREIGGFAKEIDHAVAEHDELRRILEGLERLQNEPWSAALQRLQKAVKDHIDDEEWRLLPVARKELPYHVAEHMKHEFERAKHAQLTALATP